MYDEFINKCKQLDIKNPKLDEEGVPTLYTGSKKKPWDCKPWSDKEAALTVFDEELAKSGETMHGKTLNAVMKKFDKYIGLKNAKIIIGDSEGIIIFSLNDLAKVARHFGFKKRNFSEKQLEHHKKFGQMMKDKYNENK